MSRRGQRCSQLYLYIGDVLKDTLTTHGPNEVALKMGFLGIRGRWSKAGCRIVNAFVVTRRFSLSGLTIYSLLTRSSTHTQSEKDQNQ